MGEPDDPLRADDALVGAEHEDVLLGSGVADEDDPPAGFDDSGRDDVDEHPTTIAVLDDQPTTEIPPVVEPAPEPRGRFAGVAPWAAFAGVAVVVIAATTTWAAWLQGPTAERQSFTGLIQPPASTATSAPPPPAVAAPPAPSAEPEPQPEPKPEPAARPTQRPRATRAPAPPPPPAAAVNAPATPDGEKKKEEASPPKTSAASGPAAADADARDGDAEKDSPDAEKPKPEDEEEAGSDD